MSTPHHPSDVPSPSLVRSSEAAGLQQNGPPPACAAEPKTITTSSIPIHGHPQSSHDLIGDGNAVEKTARTYENGGQSLNLTSNASTPRLSPVPPAQVPSWSLLEDQPTLESSPTLHHTTTATSSSSTTSTYARPRSLPRSMDGSSETTSQSALPSSNDRPLTQLAGEVAPPSSLNGDTASFARAARDEAFGAQRNRSRSRGSQKNVEKSIEATLVDEEPGHQARSRKSSHLLGLFKENVGYGDRRRRSQSLTSPPVINEDIREHQNGSAVHDDLGNAIESRSLEATQRVGDQHTSASRATFVDNTPQTTKTSNITSTSTTPIVVRSWSDQHPPDQKTSFDLKTAIDKASQGAPAPRKRLPSRLLEEIRHHHNVDTPFHHKFKKSQPKPVQDSQTKQAFQVPEAARPQTTHKKKHVVHDDHTSSEEGDEDDEEEGSDKEHISSALYFPHQAPSPDALQDVDIGGARDQKDKMQEVCANCSPPPHCRPLAAR